MEIQIKYRLAKQDYIKLSNHFKDVSITVSQINHFFDGRENELTNNNVFFRIRNYGEKYMASLKENINIEQDGSITRNSKEIELDADFAKRIIANPNELIHLKGDLLDYIQDTFKITSVKYLGCFKNKRLEIPWNNKTIVLDCTVYEFGTAYECEISNISLGLDCAEEIQEQFEDLLRELHVNYKYSKGSKFENFIKGRIIVE